MTNYIQLHGHKVEQLPTGINVYNASRTLTLGDGSAVQFPLPFLPIVRDLVIVPAVHVEGQTGIRIDVGQWTPARITAKAWRSLPFSVSSQAIAAQVCQAFDAALDTSWDASAGQQSVWLNAWCESNGIGVSPTPLPA